MSDVLTEEHYQSIRKGLLAAEEAISRAKKAIEAGIDASAELREAERTRESLLRIKQVYFPNR